MKKFVKILTVILSGMFVFSAVSCKQKNEEIPEPSRDIPDLTVVSEYDQGGLYDGITLTAEFYQDKIELTAKIDAALVYALSGAKSNFCYSFTGVNADGEEKTITHEGTMQDLDRAAVKSEPPQENEDPYVKVCVKTGNTISVFKPDDESVPDFAMDNKLPANSGTICVEFYLDAGDRLYSHAIITDYDVVDEKIRYREIRKLSDYNIYGTLKTAEQEEPDDSVIVEPQPMKFSIKQKNAYYSQEMNAGKGSFNSMIAIGESGFPVTANMILSVHSFSGYFDSSSPLTDIYVNFGAFGPRCKSYLQGDNGVKFDKYASLVIVSKEIDESGTVITEKERSAFDFTTTDKRNQGIGRPGASLKMHTIRRILTEDDFIGEKGEIVFKLDIVKPEWWIDESSDESVDNYIKMYYQKKDGKTYIGLSRQGLGE